MLTKLPPGEIVSDPEMAKELAQFVEDMDADPDWGVYTGGDPGALTNKLKDLQERIDRYETRVARLKAAQKIKEELHEDELKGLHEMIVCLKEEIRCLNESLQLERQKVKAAEETVLKTVQETRERLEKQEAKVQALEAANERLERLLAAATEVLAYAVGSAAIFLISYHAIPDRLKSTKMVGYAIGASFAAKAAIRIAEYFMLDF